MMSEVEGFGVFGGSDERKSQLEKTISENMHAYNSYVCAFMCVAVCWFGSFCFPAFRLYAFCLSARLSAVGVSFCPCVSIRPFI